MALKGTINAALDKVVKYTRNQTATHRRVTGGTYAPTTGLTTGATTTDTTISGTWADYTLREMAGSDGQVQVGDRRFVLAASALSSAPLITDLLIIDSTTWSVIRIKPIGIDSAKYYEFQLRLP